MKQHKSPSRLIVSAALILSLAGAQSATASGSWELSAPTIKQAKHAIRNSDYRNEHVGQCKDIARENVSCVVTSWVCYSDNDFGRSRDVATTIVGVGPRMHVWTIVPTRTDIYPGCPEDAIVLP